MSNPINVSFDLALSEERIIPLNRWGDPDYGVAVKTGSATFEGTLDRVNRKGVTPVWFSLTDSGGSPLDSIGVADGIKSPVEKPLEAIRVTAVSASTGNVSQTS